MNKKNIEKMIPIAMAVLEESIVKSGTNEIPSNYIGYIASFGPTVRQSGLLQAVAFNSANEKRKKINDLMRKVLQKAGHNEFTGKDLFLAVKNKADGASYFEKNCLKSLVLEAAIACKLAMRTFKKGKEDDSANDN